jgi:hypothetical protein
MGSFKVSGYDNGYTFVTIKVREKLSVSKLAGIKFYKERFNSRKLNDA